MTRNPYAPDMHDNISIVSGRLRSVALTGQAEFHRLGANALRSGLKEKAMIDLKALDAYRKFREMDLRANQMIDAAVAYSLHDKYYDESERPERFAHDVAQIATTALLKMIYEDDGEIRRLREERDQYKRIAEEAFRILPATFQIKAVTGQFELASADTHPKGQDPAEELGS